MDKSGKQLEKLVQDIEEHLLPHGFKVEPRTKVYNTSGTQIAELDLVITGELGSSSIFWLIECRDRPSSGPADVAWIEQLVGRRDRFNIDKIIAVSTTGFTAGAVEYAEVKGIVLRTVEAINDIASDFWIEKINHTVTDVKIAGGFYIKTPNPADIRKLTVTKPLIKKPRDSEFQPFRNFVMDLLEAKYPWKFRNDGIIDVVFEYKKPLDLLVNTEQFRATYLRVPLRITIITYQSQFLAAKKYAEGNRIIGAEGTSELTLPEGTIKIRAQMFTKPDGTRDYKVFLPENLPEGWYISEVEFDNRPIKFKPPK